MCRVHTERFHWLCTHYTWTTNREDNGVCNSCKKQQAYRLEVLYNFVCPSCQNPGTDLSLPGLGIEKPIDDGLPIEARFGDNKEELDKYQERMYRRDFEAEVERMSFKRRVKAYNNAIVLYRGERVAGDAHTGLANHELDPKLGGIYTEQVLLNSLPMRFLPKTYLIDSSEFSSPQITVVPPGMIPKDRQRCGICWGDLSVTGVEACEGSWPRMLPCGYIYGKQKYRVRRQRKTDSMVAATIDGLMTDSQLGPRWLLVRNILIRLLSPMVVVVVLTMNVGPRIGENGGDNVIRRANLPTKIAIVLACIVLSPAMYTFILWQACTG
ncbi:hypothetical protein N431DRAFT_501334 [Stipitochalara longipes BDJ]|nr:hypothetical protein N431DRAFT_501334 [Stipitochalara longipes BDJ]